VRWASEALRAPLGMKMKTQFLHRDRDAVRQDFLGRRRSGLGVLRLPRAGTVCREVRAAWQVNPETGRLEMHWQETETPPSLEHSRCPTDKAVRQGLKRRRALGMSEQKSRLLLACRARKSHAFCSRAELAKATPFASESKGPQAAFDPQRTAAGHFQQTNQGRRPLSTDNIGTAGRAAACLEF
jgi:hypothetical protein